MKFPIDSLENWDGVSFWPVVWPIALNWDTCILSQEIVTNKVIKWSVFRIIFVIYLDTARQDTCQVITTSAQKVNKDLQVTVAANTRATQAPETKIEKRRLPLCVPPISERLHQREECFPVFQFLLAM